MTDTFVHLVPIKDQSSGLFMLRVAMGGIAQNYCRLQFCRANVLFVLNLTHDCNAVQFSSAHKAKIYNAVVAASSAALSK
jgi:hypothetical protein